jgi:hypothetical protein
MSAKHFECAFIPAAVRAEVSSVCPGNVTRVHREADGVIAHWVPRQAVCNRLGTAMADVHQSRSTTIHPGVDPQTWLGFEQRIQARRFDALITSAREAIVKGNLALAAHALDEAREIRPEAKEIRALAADLDRLTPFNQNLHWRRIGGGVCLLATGVLMLVALDQVRVPPGSLPAVPQAPLLLRKPMPTYAAADGTNLLRPAVVADSAVGVGGGASLPAPAPASVGTPSVRPLSSPPSSRTVAIPRMEPRTESTRRDSAIFDSRPIPGGAPLPPRRERTSAEITAESDATAAIQTTEIATASAALPAAAAPNITRAPEPVAAVSIPAGASTTVTVRAAEDETRVADVLRRYARAYGDLDVGAAREVWPDVDQRALTRAFEGLSSQSVSFDDCQIDVAGAIANASCRGHASYVGKVGRGVARTEPRTWRFELRRDGETWKIANAEADKN